MSLKPTEVTLDREWHGSKQLAFDYLVAATGTRLAAPGTMPSDEKVHSVDYLKKYNQAIKRSNSVILIGGGAVGTNYICGCPFLLSDSNKKQASRWRVI